MPKSEYQTKLKIKMSNIKMQKRVFQFDIWALKFICHLSFGFCHFSY